MIESLCIGLKRKYGDVSRTNGPIVNYLGMVFDLSHAGEARVSKKEYVDDLLTGSGISFALLSVLRLFDLLDAFLLLFSVHIEIQTTKLTDTNTNTKLACM